MAKIYINVNKYNLMKKIFAFIFIFFNLFCWSQNSNIIRTLSTGSNTTNLAQAVAPIIEAPITNSISFDYDDAGNQVVRKPIYLAARPSRLDNPQTNESKEFVESDIYSDIKYYPNPTVEILFVNWKNNNETFVNNIQVFNFSGQLMGTITSDRSFEQAEIDFRSYPTGVYELVLVYNDGIQKTLKIIKK